PFAVAWSNVPSGAHVLTATATDAQGVSVSAAVTVTVFDQRAFATLRQIQTVFVIAMENHNFTQPSPASSPQQILSNSAAPNINTWSGTTRWPSSLTHKRKTFTLSLIFSRSSRTA